MCTVPWLKVGPGPEMRSKTSWMFDIDTVDLTWWIDGYTCSYMLAWSLLYSVERFPKRSSISLLVVRFVCNLASFSTRRERDYYYTFQSENIYMRIIVAGKSITNAMPLAGLMNLSISPSSRLYYFAKSKRIRNTKSYWSLISFAAAAA